MRETLIILWFAGLAFFVWEFLVADSLPQKYASAKPSTIRLIDLAFGSVILLTLYYLITR